MITAKLFLNNKSQALRLPKAVEFGEDVKEVTIVAVGKTRVVTPLESTWDAWFAQGTSEDAALPAREQPAMQPRETLE